MLLAVLRGDCGAVDVAFAQESLSAAAADAAAAAAAGHDDDAAAPDGAFLPGCRAVVDGLPAKSARHNGECCLVIRREGDLYDVCCGSGAALRLRPANLKTTGGEPLTTRDALWFACTLLSSDTTTTTEARQRKSVVMTLLQHMNKQKAASTTPEGVTLHPLDFRLGPMQTTPLLEVRPQVIPTTTRCVWIAQTMSCCVCF